MKCIMSFLWIVLSISYVEAFDDNDGSILSRDGDTRVPLNGIHNIVRTMPNGCTAWFHTSGWFITAGHCFFKKGTNELKSPTTKYHVEINVPFSNDNGQPVSPEDRYKFKIDTETINGFNGIEGNDWALFKLTVEDRKKYLMDNHVKPIKIHELSKYEYSATDPLSLSVAGYGMSGPPPLFGTGTKNKFSQTLQIAYGYLHGDIIMKTSNIITSDKLLHNVDTQKGNSGSPIILHRGERFAVIGIHTGGPNPFDEKDLYNKGTGFQNADLKKALSRYHHTGSHEIKGDYVPSFIHVDCCSFSNQKGDGTLFRPFTQIQDAINAAQNGDTLSIVANCYPLQKGISFPLGKKLILLFPSGKVSFVGTNINTSDIQEENRVLRKMILSENYNKSVSTRREVVRESRMCTLL